MTTGQRPIDLTAARRMAEDFVGAVTAVRPFGAGHINETFLVETVVGEYVIQRINTAVFPDPEGVTRNIQAVHRHLRGVLMPEPVPSPAGQWLMWDGASPWRAWRRAPGRPVESAAASPQRTCAPPVNSSAGFMHRVADLDPGVAHRRRCPGSTTRAAASMPSGR